MERRPLENHVSLCCLLRETRYYRAYSVKLAAAEDPSRYLWASSSATTRPLAGRLRLKRLRHESKSIEAVAAGSISSERSTMVSVPG